MYNSLIPHILQQIRNTETATNDAAHELLFAESQYFESLSRTQRKEYQFSPDSTEDNAILAKIRRINHILRNESGFSTAADYLVMLEWVKTQQEHKEKKAQAEYNRNLQGMSGPWPYAESCHIIYDPLYGK